MSHASVGIMEEQKARHHLTPVLGGVALVAAACLGLLVAYQPVWTTVAVCLGLAGVSALLWPDLCLLAAVLAAFAVRPLGEDALKLGAGVVQMCPTVLAALAIAGFTLRQRWGMIPRWNDPFHLALAVFLLIGVLSAVANGSAAPSVLESLRGYCGYVLLGYGVMVSGPRHAHLGRLVALVIVIMALQLPVQVFQALPDGRGGDWSVGTLGRNATSVLAFVAPGAACLVVGMAIERRSWLTGIAAALFGGEMVLELLLGEAKFGLLLLPVALLITALPRLRSRGTGVALAGCAFSLLVAASLAPVIIPGSPVLQIARDPLSVLRYEPAQTSYRNTYALSRVTQVTFSWRLLDGDVGRVGLGFGPGAATGSFLAALQGPLWTRYGMLYGFASTQLSNMMLEYGLLGMAAYAVALLLTWRWAAAVWRDPAQPPAWRGIALGFGGIWFLFLVGAVYYRDWIAGPIPCLFWLVAGALFTRRSAGLPPARAALVTTDADYMMVRKVP